MTQRQIDEKVMDKANFLYMCKYNRSTETAMGLRDCIIEAVKEVTHLTEAQLCSVYGCLYKDLKFDFDCYIDYLYKTMTGGENGNNK